MSAYLYICSAARSGSTLLDMLIGGHSSCASLGEFSFLGKAIKLDQTCGCGDKVRSCPAWAKVLARVKTEKGIDLLQNPYSLRQWDTHASVRIDHEQQNFLYTKMVKIRSLMCKIRYGSEGSYRLPLARSLAKGIENTIYLYDVILDEWQKDCVVDSSKNMNKAIALHEAAPDKVKILLLTRDGRGVFYSRHSSGFSREESLAGWQRYYSYALDLLDKNIPSENLLVLKYEDLVTDINESLQRICNFIGLDFEPDMVDISKGAGHLVNGNITMHKRDRGVKLDERWKSDLASEDLKWFLERAESLNYRLGYNY